MRSNCIASKRNEITIFCLEDTGAVSFPIVTKKQQRRRPFRHATSALIFPLLFHREHVLPGLYRAGFAQLKRRVLIRIRDHYRRYRAIARVQDGLFVEAANQVAFLERVALLDLDGKGRATQLHGVDAQMDKQLAALRHHQTDGVLGAEHGRHLAVGRRINLVARRFDREAVTHHLFGEHTVRDVLEWDHLAREWGRDNDGLTGRRIGRSRFWSR